MTVTDSENTEFYKDVDKKICVSDRRIANGQGNLFHSPEHSASCKTYKEGSKWGLCAGKLQLKITVR